jgi:hypothetical protein
MGFKFTTTRFLDLHIVRIQIVDLEFILGVRLARRIRQLGTWLTGLIQMKNVQINSSSSSRTHRTKAKLVG